MLASIMVQLDVDSPPTARLRSAFDLARGFEAELVAFCAADSRIHLPYGGGGAAVEAQRERREEIVARMTALRKEFVDLAADEPGRRWIGMTGNPTELLALHARAADLIVVGSPRPGAILQRDRQVDVGRLALAAGRPVLLLARDEALAAAEKVVIAWKEAREARRAVVDAMPFLGRARQVIVAHVVEGSEEIARQGCADVVRHLMQHGVRAEERLLPAGQAPARQIADLARGIDAGLVVSGAYGHSRIREWAFGGVTRSLLYDDSVNRLLSY